MLETRAWIADEARALLARVRRMQPMSMQESMTPAAAPLARTQRAIEQTLQRERSRLKREIVQLLRWLTTPAASDADGAELAHRLTRARMQFNDVLNNFDLFADALSQRSERDSGLWLAGLDVAAEDVVALPPYYETPPVLCYLDRGPGAAIRRARTRLPGGGSNPIALIQIPRERMVGTGVAASLAHETGHQAAALLELVESLRKELQDLARATGDDRWNIWHRWISEIIADLWAVAKLGPTATQGLIGVLSLPSYFVFRISANDPHPPPWLRVKLSAAFGRALYPDAQWRELDALWDDLYPIAQATPAQRGWLAHLADTIEPIAERLLAHRCPALAPQPLGAVLAMPDRAPRALRAALAHPRWIDRLLHVPPSRALAIVGQARWARAITPEDERRTVSKLLATWAIRRTFANDETRQEKVHG
jgi:hypothetical protein